MPQLAIETFISQYFWLVFFLGIFHQITTNTIIPNIVMTLKARAAVESGASEEGSANANIVARDDLIRSTFAAKSTNYTHSCFYTNNNVDVLGSGVSFGEVSTLNK
jgi:hypothetical protein